MIRICTLVVFGVFCLFFIQCSDNSTPKNLEQIDQSGEVEQPEHIFTLDEIPDRIKKVENLTVFSGDSEPKYSINLTPKQIYGETGEPYLAKIQGLSIDDNGRIIILNIDSSYKQFLYVYNTDGTYLTQIGRMGNGPGEYIYVFDVQIQFGKIIVRDVTNQRLNIYNSNDYSLERTMLIKRLVIREHEAVKGLKVGEIISQNNGNHLVSFYQQVSENGWRIHKYVLMDENGNALNYEPLEFRSSFKANGRTGSDIIPSFMPMPFMGSTIAGMSGEGELYSVWSHEFLIRKYDAQGVYQSAIYYPLKGSEFDISFHTNSFYDERDIMKAIEIHDEEFPESNPIVDRLIVDDENRIWMAVPMGVEWGNYEWWILKESGELLAKLMLTRDQPIFDIKDGYLYSKKLNEETGSEFVVKYKIELTEKE